MNVTEREREQKETQARMGRGINDTREARLQKLQTQQQKQLNAIISVLKLTIIGKHNTCLPVRHCSKPLRCLHERLILASITLTAAINTHCLIKNFLR